MSGLRERRRSHYDSIPEVLPKMVLEKQDSGISLSTTDGMDYPSKMADVDSAATSLEQLHLVGTGDITANGYDCQNHNHNNDHIEEDQSDSRNNILHNHQHHHHGSALLGTTNGDFWGPEDGIHFNNFHPGQRHSIAITDLDEHCHENGLDPDVHVPLHKTVCCALCRKKQERLEKKAAAAAAAAAATNDLHCSQESITDASSIASSIASSRASRPWIRDPLADAKPITDPVLRKKLPSATGGRSRVTPRIIRHCEPNGEPPSSNGCNHDSVFEDQAKRDQFMKRIQLDHKILQLMIQKREAKKKKVPTATLR